MEQQIVSSLPAEVASTANGTTEIVPNSHEHEPVSKLNFGAQVCLLSAVQLPSYLRQLVNYQRRCTP